MRKERVRYWAKPLTEKDISAVRQIDKDSFQFGSRKSIDGYKGCIDTPKAYGEVHVIIRTADRTVVGYVHFKPQAHNSVLLCNMATGPEYRRRGAATFTLSWLRQAAIERKISRIILHVRASNRRAIKRYLKSGYAEIDRIRCGYQSGNTDADRTKITMVLALCADRGASSCGASH